MSTKVLIPIIVSALIAAAMLGVGIWATTSAPEGANAATALIVTGSIAALLAILAVAAAVMQANARSIFAISAIVCLVASGVIGGRIYPAVKSQERYVVALERWDRSVKEGKRPDNPQNKIAFLKAEGDTEGNGQTHDRTYLINALYASTGIAVAGCLLLFATRPKAD